MTENHHRSRLSTPVSTFPSAPTADKDTTSSFSSSHTNFPAVHAACDYAYYLEAVFPYATAAQISKAAKESLSVDDAATLLYNELNPRFDDLLYMHEEEQRLRWEKQNGQKTDLFEGVEHALERRHSWVAGCAQFPSISDMGQFNGMMHVFPVDTSEWDTEWLLPPSTSGPMNFPLGPGDDEPSIREQYGKEIHFLKDTPLCAPIMRWAPDIRVRVASSRSEDGEDDPSGTNVISINLKRCPPVSRVPITSSENDGGPFSSEVENIGLDELSLDVDLTRTDEDDLTADGFTPEGTSNYDALLTLEMEKDRLRRIATALRPYVNVFSVREKCNLANTINTHCPLTKELLPLHLHSFLNLAEILLTEREISDGLTDFPISIPLLGKKLVSLGKIKIAKLIFNRKKCSISVEEGRAFRVKSSISSIVIHSIAFSYINQSDAASQLFKQTFVPGKSAINKTKGSVGHQPFAGATTGTVLVKVSNASLSADMIIFVLSTGSLELKCEHPKVTIGKLKINSSKTKLNVISAILKPVVKYAVAKAIENALYSVIKI